MIFAKTNKSKKAESKESKKLEENSKYLDRSTRAEEGSKERE